MSLDKSIKNIRVAGRSNVGWAYLPNNNDGNQPSPQPSPVGEGEYSQLNDKHHIGRMLWKNQTFCTKSQISAKAVKRVQHDSKTHDVTLNLFQGLSNLEFMNKNDNTLSFGRGQGEGRFKKKTAFTLAKVLITLVVIGVVAAITVPMMHANYQKQATVSKLKKAYSNLSNAIKLSELDNGPLKNWELPLITDTADNDDTFMNKYLYSYFKIDKHTKVTEEVKGWGLNNIDGTYTNLQLTWYSLTDGTSIASYSQGSAYFWIFIDLNSSVKPNRLGKDIFVFNIKDKFGFWHKDYKTDSSLINNSTYGCKKGTEAKYAGMFCGALIFNHGFEMPKDYPW